MAKDKRRTADGKKAKPAKAKTPGKGVSALIDAAVDRASTDLHNAASRAGEEQAAMIGALRAEIDSLRREVEGLRSADSGARRTAKPPTATKTGSGAATSTPRRPRGGGAGSGPAAAA